MAFYLVQFVEDELYHVCPKSRVRHNVEEPGLVSAKYKGIYFGAVIISEGEKSKMEELKDRCITNNILKKKYKLSSPSTEITTTSWTKTASKVKKSLFYQHATSSTSSNLEPLTEMKTMAIEKYYDDTQPSIHPQPTSSTSQRDKDFRASRPDTDNVPETENIIDMEIEEEQQQQESDQEPEQERELHQEQEQDQGQEQNQEQYEEQDREEEQKGKKYYCPYCRTLYKQFARHLYQVHSGESEVAAVMNLEKNNPERRRVIAALRAKGSKIFNSLQTLPSKVILPRMKKTINLYEYIACYLCGNLYKTKFLHRHIKKCPNKGPAEQTKQVVRTAKKQQFLEEDDAEQVIKFKRDVVSGMREGEVKIELLKDPLLQSYGRFMCSYYGTDKHLINLIRRKLKQVTEILLAVKQLDNDIAELKDIFQPRKKCVLFNAIKKVTGFEMGVFKRPAMANEMATLLKQCLKRYLLEETMPKTEEEEKLAKKWLKLIAEDYNAYIGKHARKTLESNQWRKQKLIPLTDDVMKLNIHVKKVAEEASVALKKEFSFPEWSSLNKATMVKLVLFNRKRVGDVTRITIDDFEKSHKIQKGTVTYEMLSESEKLLSSNYKRLQARGKRGKIVAMLLTKDIIKNITLILKLRDRANIPDSNSYVFAKTPDDVFKAQIALKEMAFESKAKYPQLITGTSLRREIATVTQAFNFSNNDLSILANFLGHTLQTHSQFYRLPDEAIQLAKISVVLQAIDSGKIGELKGKSLEEINKYAESLIYDKDVESKEDQEVDEAAVGPSSSPSTPKKKLKIIRKSWTTPEKAVMRKQFKRHIDSDTLPTPMECYDAKNRYTPLKCRTVAQIKAWVFNENRRKKRNLKPLKHMFLCSCDKKRY